MIHIADTVVKWFDRPFPVGASIHEQYIIEKMIGMGSYGFAYVAEDIQSGKNVLLKQLRKRIKVKNPSFAHEIDILSSLSHPSIPKLLDSFTWEKKQWIVMSYFPVKNVEDLIFEEKRNFFEKDSLLLLQKVGQVVTYFHDNGVVHRDLRIPNILYDNQEVYVIDFGLARRIGDTNAETRKYTVYKREIEVQSDINALGHFLLFLLYSSFAPISRKEKSWQEELNITCETKNITERMLGIQPEYGDIKELLADIKKVLRSHT